MVCSQTDRVFFITNFLLLKKNKSTKVLKRKRISFVKGSRTNSKVEREERMDNQVLQEIVKRAEEQIAGSRDLTALNDIRVQFLGKKELDTEQIGRAHV